MFSLFASSAQQTTLLESYKTIPNGRQSGNGWGLFDLISLLTEFTADNEIYKYSVLFPVPVRWRVSLFVCEEQRV